MNTKITILHISDIQFGKNHRFGRLAFSGNDKFDTLLSRLSDDLSLLEKKNEIHPDLMILTGDLAECGFESEFKDVLKFINGIAKHLKLSTDKVIIVPGNHDINRFLCEAYIKECEGYQEKPVWPYYRKWELYIGLFNKLYKGLPSVGFSEDQPWTLFEIPDLKVVVAGFNSTMKESHDENDHYGWVGEEQLKWFAEQLDTYKENGWLRIGALHHNLKRNPVADNENLRDAEFLENITGNLLNLILHGHTHNGKTYWSNKIPVLATGSAALTSNARPEEILNQYQIIQVYSDRFCRWTRQYNPSNKKWIGDNSLSDDGDSWFKKESVDFDCVFTTFPKLDSPPPPLPPSFIVGRGDVLKEIIQKLKNFGCVYIWGMPGIGKTALALEATKCLKRHFQGRIIYKYLTEELTYNDILNIVARSFSRNGLLDCSHDEKQDEIKFLLRHNEPVLIYLDNMDQNNLGLVSSLEALSKYCSLLITCRKPPQEDWYNNTLFYSKELIQLDRSSSIELFRKFYNQSRSSQNEKCIGKMCEILEDRPLSIILCASYAKLLRIPICRFVSLLPSPNLPQKFINLSYKKLDSKTQEFFAILSLFEGRAFNINAIKAMWGNEDACERLNQLTNFSLVIPIGDTSYSLHQEVQEVAASHIQDSNNKAVFLDRMIKYFCEFAEKNRTDFEELGIERENIFATMKECDKRSDTKNYLSLADSLLKKYPGHYAYGFLLQKGFWQEGVEIVNRCIELTKKDSLMHTKLYEHLGLFHYLKGEHDKARLYFSKALELTRLFSEAKEEAIILQRLGFIESDEGSYHECERLYRESLEIAKKHKLDNETLASGIHLVGVILYHQCRYEESRKYLERALRIRKEISSVAESVTKRRLAGTYRRQGLISEAEEMLLDCLRVEKEAENERNIARCLRQVGMLNLLQGFLDKARSNFEDSYDIFQKIGNKKGTASVLTNLGELKIKQGELEDAESDLNKSLTMARDLQSQYGKAINLRWIAEIYYKRSKFQSTLEKVFEALHHFESIEHIHVDDVCQLFNKALIGINLDETGRVSLPKFFEGQCSNQIEIKFKELWEESKPCLKANDPHIDKYLLDLKNDRRRGLSLIIRPSEEIKLLLSGIRDRLQKIAPNHHYYDLDEYHVTVMSLITASGPLPFKEIMINQCKHELFKIMSHYRPFLINFQGISGTKDCVMARGFYRDDTLNLLREELREKATKIGIPGNVDDRYRNMSAHVTFARFRSQENLKEVVKEIEKLESCQLGICQVDTIELVINDWYMSKNKVKVLESFKLQ